MTSSLEKWKKLQVEFVKAREECRVAWAVEYSGARDAKTDTAKKAIADVKTSELRLARDLAEVDAVAAWQVHLIENK